MKKTDTVLVGIGGYGNGYVKEAFDGASREFVNVVAAVEPFPDSAKNIGLIRERNIPVYCSLEEFLRHGKAELAVLCTPIAFHAEQIIACMEHGMDVLCEKPLCADEKDIDRIRAVRDKTGKHLLVGFQWSCNPAILAAKRDITAGIYGKPTELKTLVLFPRGDSYFHRSTGWAGKIYDAEGRAVYDSVANNAAAHYLHNLFFMMGDAPCNSRMPDDVYAELGRANPIENFDTAVISCKINGAEATFIASHATREEVNPVFRFTFERGVIFNVSPFPPENAAADAEPDEIIGILADGSRRSYGKALGGGDFSKLGIAARIAQGVPMDGCTLEGAEVHTRVISHIQRDFPIRDFQNLRREGDMNVVEGLYDLLIDLYAHPHRGALEAFVKENSTK